MIAMTDKCNVVLTLVLQYSGVIFDFRSFKFRVKAQLIIYVN